jgi:hypothetical protein
MARKFVRESPKKTMGAMGFPEPTAAVPRADANRAAAVDAANAGFEVQRAKFKQGLSDKQDKHLKGLQLASMDHEFKLDDKIAKGKSDLAGKIAAFDAPSPGSSTADRLRELQENMQRQNEQAHDISVKVDEAGNQAPVAPELSPQDRVALSKLTPVQLQKQVADWRRIATMLVNHIANHPASEVYSGSFKVSAGTTAGRVAVTAGRIMYHGQCLRDVAAVTDGVLASAVGTGAGYLTIRWDPASATAPFYSFTTVYPTPVALSGSIYVERVLATCTRSAATGNALSGFSQVHFGDLDNVEPPFDGPFAVRKSAALGVYVSAGKCYYGTGGESSYAGGSLVITGAAAIIYVYATLTYSGGSYSLAVASAGTLPTGGSGSVVWKLAELQLNLGQTDIIAVRQCSYGDLHVYGRLV